MPRAVVVLPSTTYRAHDFVSAAESLGIDLVVASENPPPFDMGDRYLHIDCSDPQSAADSIAALGDEIAFDGVVAADDAGVLVASLAGTTLGLAANTPDAAEATRDKLLLRTRLATTEVPQPRFAVLEPTRSSAEEASSAVGFPLVVKPLSRSASQGVIRVDRPQDLSPTIDRVREIIGDRRHSQRLLLEAYLPGDEVAVEGIIGNGELMVLAIFDKPDTGEGPSFPETILVTPSRLSDESQQECIRVAEAALRGLGLTHGPVHIELKIHNGRASVLEVAARSIGGLCSRSLSFGLMGTTLETLILRNAVGMDKPELRREQHASGVLMIPIPRSGILSSIEGIDQARTIPHITGVDITINVGSDILAPPEGDRYLGFVFARADTPDTVESALRKAKNTISVLVT
ncbi:MAG: ATP-grasp domain-containing protein [Acidimicrobiia bacterium]